MTRWISSPPIHPITPNVNLLSQYFALTDSLLLLGVLIGLFAIDYPSSIQFTITIYNYPL
jgi:hypothetical protein